MTSKCPFVDIGQILGDTVQAFADTDRVVYDTDLILSDTVLQVLADTDPIVEHGFAGCNTDGLVAALVTSSYHARMAYQRDTVDDLE